MKLHIFGFSLALVPLDFNFEWKGIINLRNSSKNNIDIATDDAINQSVNVNVVV